MVTAVAPDAQTRYAPVHPVDIASTLGPLRRGAADPTFRVRGSDFWRTVRTPDGAATIQLARSGGAIEARAWGPGAAWAIDGVPELLGRDDDWSALDVTANELLRTSLHRNPGLRLTRTRRVGEALFAAILEQKVTGGEARRAWAALVSEFGDSAPGPAPAGMRVFPTVAAWRRIPSWSWHRAGVGPQRSDTAMRVAAVADSLERTLGSSRDGAAAERALRSIPGVGVWTAAETRQRAHGDPDAPSIGDYHLPALVGWALIGKPVDDDGMLELLEPWAGQRQRIMRLITASGVRKPRFGPRMTIQDHRAH